jgi:N6-adenosine-specific RNA methylase IME4
LAPTPLDKAHRNGVKPIRQRRSAAGRPSRELRRPRATSTDRFRETTLSEVNLCRPAERSDRHISLDEIGRIAAPFLSDYATQEWNGELFPSDGAGRGHGGNLALPQQKFGVIVADPAWGRTVYSTATGMDRHAANHYATATGDELTQDDGIKAWPIASIAADDCVLGLWCTEPWRGEAVMRAWGFKPVAYFVWVKDIVVLDPADNGMLRSGQKLDVVGPAGLGFWNRDRCEIMLIGEWGNPVCPAPGKQGERVWFARRGEHATNRDEVHSDKPD